MIRLIAILCAFLWCIVGCGGYTEQPSLTVAKVKKFEEGSRQGGQSTNKVSDADSSYSEFESKRKIIYSAELSVVVEDFDQITESIYGTAKKHGGFVAQEYIDTHKKMSRTGRWTVRIAVSKFDSFMEEMSAIGALESRTQNAQDVTEEYVDTEARITNTKRLEARILELLNRPNDKIQHVIEVERELARVRESIERMQGRLRYLADRTELATVIVNVREVKEYRPAQESSFTGRLVAAWNGSVERSSQWLQDVTVNVVSNTFSILGWLTSASLGLLVFRRIQRKLPATSP